MNVQNTVNHLIDSICDAANSMSIGFMEACGDLITSHGFNKFGPNYTHPTTGGRTYSTEEALRVISFKLWVQFRTDSKEA